MWFFSAVNSASAFFQIQLLLIIFSLAWKKCWNQQRILVKKKSKILVWINVKKCSFARKCILQRTKLAIAHLLTAFIWLRAAKFFKNHHSQIFEKNKLTSFKRQVGRKKARCHDGPFATTMTWEISRRQCKVVVLCTLNPVFSVKNRPRPTKILEVFIYRIIDSWLIKKTATRCHHGFSTRPATKFIANFPFCEIWSFWRL